MSVSVSESEGKSERERARVRVSISKPAAKSALRSSQSAALATNSALGSSQSTVPVTKSALQGPQSIAPATKSANEPHVHKSRFTAPVTKSERVEDHHHIAPVTNSQLWTFKKRASATKSDPHVRKCARYHSESTVAISARRTHPDFASLRSRNALRGFREA